MKMTIRSPMPHSASRVSAGLDQVGVVEPAGLRQAELAEDRVDRAGAGVEQEGEGHGRGDRRGEVRQVEEGAEERRRRA